MLTGIQRLCASLPQGEAEVWLRNGEITFSVKWATDETVISGLGNGFCFLLNGQSKEVKVAELAKEPSNDIVEASLSRSPDTIEIQKDKINSCQKQKTLSKEQESCATLNPAPLENPSKPEVQPSRQQNLLQQLLDYLRQHYAFRYNRLTDQTECAALAMENDAKEKLSTGKLIDNERHTVKIRTCGQPPAEQPQPGGPAGRYPVLGPRRETLRRFSQHSRLPSLYRLPGTPPGMGRGGPRHPPSPNA